MHILLILLFSLESSQIKTIYEFIWIIAIWLIIVAIYKPSKDVFKIVAGLGVVEILMFSLILFSPGPPLFSFGAISITTTGLKLFAIAITRWLLSVSVILTIVEKVGFHNIVDELIALKVPENLIIILLFTYRYIFLLLEELKNTTRSIKMRNLNLNIFTQEGRKVGSMAIYNILKNAYNRYQFVSLAIKGRGAIYIKNLRKINTTISPKLINTLTILLAGGMLLWLI